MAWPKESYILDAIIQDFIQRSQQQTATRRNPSCSNIRSPHVHFMFKICPQQCIYIMARVNGVKGVWRVRLSWASATLTAPCVRGPRGIDIPGIDIPLALNYVRDL